MSPWLLLTLPLPLLLDTLRSCIGQSVYNGLGRREGRRWISGMPQVVCVQAIWRSADQRGGGAGADSHSMTFQRPLCGPILHQRRGPRSIFRWGWSKWDNKARGIRDRRPASDVPSPPPCSQFYLRIPVVCIVTHSPPALAQITGLCSVLPTSLPAVLALTLPYFVHHAAAILRCGEMFCAFCLEGWL